MKIAKMNKQIKLIELEITRLCEFENNNCLISYLTEKDKIDNGYDFKVITTKLEDLYEKLFGLKCSRNKFNNVNNTVSDSYSINGALTKLAQANAKKQRISRVFGISMKKKIVFEQIIDEQIASLQTAIDYANLNHDFDLEKIDDNKISSEHDKTIAEISKEMKIIRNRIANMSNVFLALNYKRYERKITAYDEQYYLLSESRNNANNIPKTVDNKYTIGDALVMLSILQNKKLRLERLAANKQKERRITSNGVIEYTEALYNLDDINKELGNIDDEIASMQINIDLANSSLRL